MMQTVVCPDLCLLLFLAYGEHSLLYMYIQTLLSFSFSFFSLYIKISVRMYNTWKKAYPWLNTLTDYSALDVEFYFYIKFVELIVCVTKVKIVAKKPWLLCRVDLSLHFEHSLSQCYQDNLFKCFMGIYCLEAVSVDCI